MKRLLISLLLCQFALASAAAAQTLADVARKEEQRRKTVKKADRVYTNKDLHQTERAPAAEGQPAQPAAATPPAGQPSTESTEPKDAEKTPAEDDTAKTREEWQSQIAQGRADLDRSRMFAEALQTRTNSLWADFTARDDPAQRAAIEVERKKTIAEMDRVKAEIEAKTKALADLEEQARRAGVPPGWLR
jgi:hypothetical protein